MPSSIIQRLLQHHHVSNVDVISDDVKLKIYVLALKEIRNRMAKRKPRDISLDSLVECEDALQEISCAFYDLRHTRIGKDFQLRQNVVPKVNKALGEISKALAKGGRNASYFDYFIKCRDTIFQVCSYFAEDDEDNIL